MGCPEVDTPSFLSWIEYAEPAKVALLQYANNGEPIPEIDMLMNSLQGVFKIYMVFDDEKYQGDSFCKGFMFSQEISKLIFKFGFTQMEKTALAKASDAKKIARASRREDRKAGRDVRVDTRGIRK